MEDGLEGLIGLRGRIDGAVRNSGRDADAANLSVDSADEDGSVRRIGGAEVGDLRGDDVVEDAAAGVERHLVGELVGHRRARLPTEERRAREERAHVGLDRLAQRLRRHRGPCRGTIRRAAQRGRAD